MMSKTRDTKKDQLAEEIKRLEEKVSPESREQWKKCIEDDAKSTRDHFGLNNRLWNVIRDERDEKLTLEEKDQIIANELAWHIRFYEACIREKYKNKYKSVFLKRVRSFILHSLLEAAILEQYWLVLEFLLKFKPKDEEPSVNSFFYTMLSSFISQEEMSLENLKNFVNRYSKDSREHTTLILRSIFNSAKKENGDSLFVSKFQFLLEMYGEDNPVEGLTIDSDQFKAILNFLTYFIQKLIIKQSIYSTQTEILLFECFMNFIKRYCHKNPDLALQVKLTIEDELLQCQMKSRFISTKAIQLLISPILEDEIPALLKNDPHQRIIKRLNLFLYFGCISEYKQLSSWIEKENKAFFSDLAKKPLFLAESNLDTKPITSISASSVPSASVSSAASPHAADESVDAEASSADFKVSSEESSGIGLGGGIPTSTAYQAMISQREDNELSKGLCFNFIYFLAICIDSFKESPERLNDLLLLLKYLVEEQRIFLTRPTLIQLLLVLLEVGEKTYSELDDALPPSRSAVQFSHIENILTQLIHNKITQMVVIDLLINTTTKYKFVLTLIEKLPKKTLVAMTEYFLERKGLITLFHLFQYFRIKNSLGELFRKPNTEGKEEAKELSEDSVKFIQLINRTVTNLLENFLDPVMPSLFDTLTRFQGIFQNPEELLAINLKLMIEVPLNHSYRFLIFKSALENIPNLDPKKLHKITLGGKIYPFYQNLLQAPFADLHALFKSYPLFKKEIEVYQAVQAVKAPREVNDYGSVHRAANHQLMSESSKKLQQIYLVPHYEKIAKDVTDPEEIAKKKHSFLINKFNELYAYILEETKEHFQKNGKFDTYFLFQSWAAMDICTGSNNNKRYKDLFKEDKYYLAFLFPLIMQSHLFPILAVPLTSTQQVFHRDEASKVSLLEVLVATWMAINDPERYKKEDQRNGLKRVLMENLATCLSQDRALTDDFKLRCGDGAMSFILATFDNPVEVEDEKNTTDSESSLFSSLQLTERLLHEVIFSFINHLFDPGRRSPSDQKLVPSLSKDEKKKIIEEIRRNGNIIPSHFLRAHEKTFEIFASKVTKNNTELLTKLRSIYQTPEKDDLYEIYFSIEVKLTNKFEKKIEEKVIEMTVEKFAYEKIIECEELFKKENVEEKEREVKIYPNMFSSSLSSSLSSSSLSSSPQKDQEEGIQPPDDEKKADSNPKKRSSATLFQGTEDEPDRTALLRRRLNTGEKIQVISRKKDVDGDGDDDDLSDEVIAVSTLSSSSSSSSSSSEDAISSSSSSLLTSTLSSTSEGSASTACLTTTSDDADSSSKNEPSSNYSSSNLSSLSR